MASDIVNLELDDPVGENYVMNGYPILEKNLDRCTELLQTPEFVNWFYNRVGPGKRFSCFSRDGPRKRLLIEETKNNIEALRRETEKGLALYTKLLSIIGNAALIEQSIKMRIHELKHSGTDNLTLMESYQDFCHNNKNLKSHLSIAVDKLQETGIFDENAILLDTDFIISLCIHFRGIRGGVTPVVVPRVGGGVWGVLGRLGCDKGGDLRRSGGDVGGGVGRRIVRGAGIGLLVCATGLIFGSPGMAYTLAKSSSSTIRIVAISMFVSVLIAGVLAALLGIAFSLRGYDRVRGRKLKKFTDSLIDMNLLSELNSHHVSLTKLTEEFKESIDSFENKVNSLINPARTPANLDEATLIYKNTFQENCRLGGNQVPIADVSKLQIAMATKAAETACETFLKEKLSYSDAEVNDFLRNLQN